MTIVAIRPAIAEASTAAERTGNLSVGIYRKRDSTTDITQFDFLIGSERGLMHYDMILYSGLIT